LAEVVKAEGSICYRDDAVLIELNEHMFRFASAGGPEPVLMHADGTY